MPGLLLEHHFLVLSPLTRVMRRTYSVWIALGVTFSGDFSSHARIEEDMIVSRVESGDWTVCSPGEGGGSSPEMPQVLQSSKKLQNDCFS